MRPSARGVRGRCGVFGASLIFLVLTYVAPAASGQSAAPSPDNCDLFSDQCLQYSLASPHFVVFYNTTGRFAVTPAWAQNVSTMAETAYSKLVKGEGFIAPARNPLPIYLDLARGGFTSFTTCEACPPPAGGVQDLEIEYRYVSPCPTNCGIPTSNWEIAHEVFGTIEFSMFGGPLPYGSWLSESSANWAGYTVTGNESRWDPLTVSAWLGPNGSTETPILQRTFDNAFFWAFLSEHYGGPEIIKRMLLGANLTNANEDVAAQLRALGYKETLAQVMDDFAAGILTGNFTERDAAAAAQRSLPPIAATNTWGGGNQTVSTFTAAVNGLRAGDPLQVRIPYGIEYVMVKPSSNATLAIRLTAQNSSCFASRVVTERGGDFVALQAPRSGPVTINSPERFDAIFLAVSRGDCAGGAFSVDLSKAAVTRSGGPDPILLAALAVALAAAALTAFVEFGRPRGRRPPDRAENR